MRDFSSKTLTALGKRGIRVLRATVIPNPASDMPFATGERGYVVDDNGTSRVWTFTEVCKTLVDRVPA